MELPNPPRPVLRHGLTVDQCVTYTHIVLTWGAAESDIGDALTFASDITDGDIADDLIHVLDGKKKITLLQRALERRSLSHAALPILKKIAKGHERWAADRNILAHGFGAVGDEGTLIFAAKAKDPLPASFFHEA